MAKYHKYIFNKKKKKLINNFEKAYIKFPNIWPSQRNLNEMRFNVTRGYLISKYFKNKKRILEIGCGYGDFSSDLSKLNLGNVVACDVSNTAIFKAKKKFQKKIKFIPKNYIDIVTKKKFDVIIMLGVFQYVINNFKIYFDKINKDLKKNGVFILSFPLIEKPIGTDKKMGIGDYYNLIQKFFKIENYLLIPNSTKPLKKNSFYNYNFLTICKKK
jgi:2-polyprenyl-3-methyl-5-hydroxy-6-metoxy-1,4-benzoquinol methylase